MNPYSFTLLFFGFSSFFVGLFVWFKRSDVTGRIFFFFSLFTAVWAFGFAMMVLTDVDYNLALFCARFADTSIVLSTVLWYHFSCSYAELMNKKKLLIFVIYVLGGVFSLTGFTPYFIPTVEPKAGFSYFVEPGPIFHFFTVYFFIVVALGFKNFFYKYSNAPDTHEKKQVAGFILASGFGYIGGGITFLVNYDVELPQYNIMLMPFYPFLMAYFLAKRDLFDPRKLAELAHQEKMQTIAALASSVNHEIRNPLYIIKSHGETFLEKKREKVYSSEEEKEKGSAFVEKAVEQTTRAMDIMRRFSSFAKQGTNEVKQEKIKLRDTITDVLQLLSYEIEVEKINIEVRVDDDLVVMFDRRHLEQALFNLIRNACQEVDQKGKIVISAKSVGTTVEIAIEDNGPGIPKDRLNQIFEPFYSTKEAGSGVGLYVTKQLVENNNGQISVASEIGRGTKFVLTMCLHEKL